MKKKQLLIFSAFLFSFVINAQNKLDFNIPQEQAAFSSKAKSVDPDFSKQSIQFSKAVGDTLYYQDFTGGLPQGWSIVNNNSSNNFVWKWDTVYQNGQFSSPGNVIVSSTAANGFMSLPSDFYNTPTPGTGGVSMDTYFESDSIDLTKGGTITPPRNIIVTYQQTLRRCCLGSVKHVLQVSTDNFVTFQEYDATNGLALSAASGTVVNAINISTATLGSSAVKIRFLAEGNVAYYWMIDDLAIIEVPRNDLELRDPYLEFNSSYTYNPFYNQIPCDLFSPLALSGFVYNNGSNDLTGVRLEGDIFNTATGIGNILGPGLGLVCATSTTPIALQSGIIRDTADYAVTNNPRFVPPVLGEFRVDMIATSDSVDENLGNEDYSQTFTTSDTIFARDDNGYGGGIGPGSYARAGQTGGTAARDKFGTMYIIESRTGNGGTWKVPTSITFAVSNAASNIGVTIVPKIWSYSEDSLFTAGTINSAFAGGEVASAFIPYTILSADTNSLLTLPLDNGTAVFNGLDSGQYVVGWEVLNTNGGNSFEIQSDASSGQFQKLVTCFVDLAHAPGWGWVDANPVIRLNMGNLPYGGYGTIGIEENSNKSLDFSVSPNPNSGLFNLEISNRVKTTYNLNVRNLLGQQVYTENITVNGTITKQMDLTHLEKGVYVVSLENGAEKILKKVVVK